LVLTQINQQELENLRHLIGAHDTGAKKLEDYAQQCSDTEVQQMFQQSAQRAQQTKQKLMQFLS
jgi:type III secretory pathway component EscR